jgi:hypothetical protein
MQFFALLIVLALASSAFAFTSSVNSRVSTRLNAKSKSVPFLEQPKALDGKAPGDVGFDPLGFTGMWQDKDWSTQVVPDFWNDETPRTPISTKTWMQEAEIKHGRICMMAVVGWLAVDSGIRFPGSPYGSITNSVSAHAAAVENGSLGFMLFVISVLELASGAAIYDQAKGSGRMPGDFNFDPLGFSKDASKLQRYKTNEVKNGRLAMLAFSGIVTQAVLFPDRAFPYF